MTIPPPEPSNPYEAPYSPGPPPASPPPPPAPYGSSTPPPAPPYGSSPYGYTPPPAPASSGQNGLALAGMITGIVSIPLCCCGLFNLPVAIVAIVLSVIGLNQIKQTGQQGKPFAIAGIATGAAGMLLALANVIFTFANPDIINRFN